MHHESFNIFIQHRLSKFLLINDFDLAGGWKGFFGSVGSPGELFLSKLDVSITTVRKSMPRNILMLMSASKKVY